MGAQGKKFNNKVDYLNHPNGHGHHGGTWHDGF